MTNKYGNLNAEELKEFCERNYCGMSRTQIKKTNSEYYHTLLEKDLEDKVLPQKNYGTRPYKDFSLKDFKELYKKKYFGKGITEVRHINRSFLTEAKRRGFASKIFPIDRRKRVKQDPRKNFKKNFTEEEIKNKLKVFEDEIITGNKGLDYFI